MKNGRDAAAVGPSVASYPLLVQVVIILLLSASPEYNQRIKRTTKIISSSGTRRIVRSTIPCRDGVTVVSGSRLSRRQRRYTTPARSNEISARRSAPSFVIAPGLVCRPLSGNISWILCTRSTKVGSYRLAESTRDRRRLSWKSSSPPSSG